MEKTLVNKTVEKQPEEIKSDHEEDDSNEIDFEIEDEDDSTEE